MYMMKLNICNCLSCFITMRITSSLVTRTMLITTTITIRRRKRKEKNETAKRRKKEKETKRCRRGG